MNRAEQVFNKIAISKEVGAGIGAGLGAVTGLRYFGKPSSRVVYKGLKGGVNIAFDSAVGTNTMPQNIRWVKKLQNYLDPVSKKWIRVGGRAGLAGIAGLVGVHLLSNNKKK